MTSLSARLSSKWLIGIAVVIFLMVMVSVYYLVFRFASQANRTITPNEHGIITQSADNQQVRRVVLKKQVGDGEEMMELFADGRVNYYDKNGKLKKSGRRGFAETQNLMRQLENLINKGQRIAGFNGYTITIETEQGTITINPGDPGSGGEVPGIIIDYINDTLNPTPRPTPIPTPRPSVVPTPLATATPEPSPGETPQPVREFTCDDYYTSGKPLKISNTICGPQ